MSEMEDGSELGAIQEMHDVVPSGCWSGQSGNVV
jgi:hypothetical protein